jgi:hypothetical protein
MPAAHIVGGVYQFRYLLDGVQASDLASTVYYFAAGTPPTVDGPVPLHPVPP